MGKREAQAAKAPGQVTVAPLGRLPPVARSPPMGPRAHMPPREAASLSRGRPSFVSCSGTPYEAYTDPRQGRGVVQGAGLARMRPIGRASPSRDALASWP